MGQRLLLGLLRNIFDLCRRSLRCLLRLLLALSPRLLKGPRLMIQAGDKERKQPFGTTNSSDVGHQGDLHAPERTVAFMACSTTPRRPPPTRTHTRRTTFESYYMGPTCSSPTSTLRQGSDNLSPSLRSPKSPMLRLSDEDGNVTDEFHGPSGETFAEPATIVAIPDKPFRSFLPSMTSRYDRNIIIRNDFGPWIFGPLETVSVYDELSVPGWQYYVHPEGQLYFLSSRRFKYITEENLDNSPTLAEAERFIAAFERRAVNYNLPSNVEVVFELQKDHWLYYMVDLDNRLLVWIDRCIIDDSVLPAHFGIEHREHTRHMFEFEYWQHIEYFPNHRGMQDGLLDELLAILLHLHIDVETSLESTSALDPDELKSMISSVKKLRSLQTSKHVLPYIIHASARMMGLLVNERFFNFHGFNGARLSPFQSVRGQNGKKIRSLLITLLSPVLFYAPEVHLSALDKVWVDSTVKVRHWKKFQEKIERDWEQFILYATVLVNANVAFLAIPNIMSDDLGPGLLTSPAGVVSQISIIASLGSIIIGLLLVRQTRNGAKDCCEDYLTYIETRNHPRLGLETLAILYSLPYALLIWGMATFLSAIAISCYYNIAGDITITRMVVYSIVWAFLLAFIAVTILTGWKKIDKRPPPISLPTFDSNSETESPVDSDAPPGPGLGLKTGSAMPRKKSNANINSILNDSITEEVELDMVDSDSRSIRSHRSSRSVRSRLTASSTVVPSIRGSWRPRNPRNRSEPADAQRTRGFLSFTWPWRGRSAPADVNRGGLPQFEMRPTA